MAHPVSLEAIEALKAEITSRIASTSAMFDKLDTTHWPAKDIRTYEALLEEKRQLERDHHKLALNEGKSQASRKATRADFHNDPDDFRYDSEIGGYKFVGRTPCAIDPEATSPCNHEICKQATREGLSYMQYTTVRHYQSRIATAKTFRMKEALRKQRDGQLLKDKEAEAEFKEKAMKKFKSMGKEAGDTIAAAAASLFPPADAIKPVEDLIDDIEADTPIERIGRELSALRAKDLRPAAQTFANTVMSRLVDNKMWQTWRDCSPCIDYFSSIRISHVHATVFLIQDILELNAIYSYELDTALASLVLDIKDSLRHVPVKYKSSVSLNVAEALHQIKVHMNPEQAQSILEEVPDGALRRVLENCIVIEDDARAEFWDVAQLAIQKLLDPEKELKLIRDKALTRSPVPSVSKKQLQLNIAHVRNYCIIHTLIRKAVQGENSAALSSSLIEYVRNMAEHKVEKFLDILDDVEIVFDDLCEAPNDQAIPNEHQQLMACLFDTVQHPIGADIRRERDEMRERAIKSDEAVSLYLDKIRELPIKPDLLPGMDPESSADTMRQFMRVILEVKDDAEDLRDRFLDILRENVWRGISEAFVVFRYCKNDQPLHCDRVTFELVQSRTDIASSTFSKGGEGLHQFLNRSYQSGWCLPAAFVRLTALLPYLSALSPASAKRTLNVLAYVGKGVTTALPKVWEESVPQFATLFLHTFGYLAIEFMTLLGRSDVEQLALTMTNTLFFHVFMQPTKIRAMDNLHYIMIWLRFLLNPKGSQKADIWLQKLTADYKMLFERPGHLCTTPTVCMSETEELPNQSMRDYVSMPAVQNTDTEQYLAVVEAHGRAQQSENLSSHPNITIHESSRSRKKRESVEVSLKDHDAVLEDLLSEKYFSELVSAKTMKYCALRLKFYKAYPTSLNKASLQKLCRLFTRAENKSVRIPEQPCSNIQNTRNHCDIWELMEFKEKIVGFFLGYKSGFRDNNDIRQLARSIMYFAMQGDLCWSMSEVFDLKVTHLKGIAGDLWPEEADVIFDQVARQTEQMQEQPDVKLQLSINRRDYILWTQSQHDKPSYAFFYDLANESLDVFKEYARNMDIEYELAGELRELQEIRKSVLEIVKMAETNTLEEREDGPLGKLAAYAIHSMMTRNHDDTIFSSDEESEEDYEEDEQPVEAEITYHENYPKPAHAEMEQTNGLAQIEAVSGTGQPTPAPTEQSQVSASQDLPVGTPSRSSSSKELTHKASANIHASSNPPHTNGHTTPPHPISTDRKILTPKSRVPRSPINSPPLNTESLNSPPPSAHTLSALQQLLNLTPDLVPRLASAGFLPPEFGSHWPHPDRTTGNVPLSTTSPQLLFSTEVLEDLERSLRDAYNEDPSIVDEIMRGVIPDLPLSLNESTTFPVGQVNGHAPNHNSSDTYTASALPTNPALLNSLNTLTGSIHDLTGQLSAGSAVQLSDPTGTRAEMDEVFKPVCKQLSRLEGQCRELQRTLELRQRHVGTSRGVSIEDEID